MQTNYIYAIAVGGVFLIFFIINLLPLLIKCNEYMNSFVSNWFTYPYVLRRYRYAGPWTPSDILLHLVYMGINAFCLRYGVSSIRKAGSRAGNLSMVNMAPLFIGTHLEFLADRLGVSLRTYTSIHRSMGLMSTALLLFHILTVVMTKESFSLSVSENRYGLIVSVPGFGWDSP